MVVETSKSLFMESKVKQIKEEVASHISQLKCKSTFIEFIGIWHLELSKSLAWFTHWAVELILFSFHLFQVWIRVRDRFSSKDLAMRGTTHFPHYVFFLLAIFTCTLIGYRSNLFVCGILILCILSLVIYWNWGLIVYVIFWELKLVGSSWWYYVWNRICWCYESQVCLGGGMMWMYVRRMWILVMRHIFTSVVK